MAQEKDRWWGLVNAVVHFRITQSEGNLLNIRTIMSCFIICWYTVPISITYVVAVVKAKSIRERKQNTILLICTNSSSVMR